MTHTCAGRGEAHPPRALRRRRTAVGEEFQLRGAGSGVRGGDAASRPQGGLAVDAAAGLAAGLARVGLSDEFLGQVRDEIGPGTSALFLLTHDAVVGRIAEAFRGTHAGLLVSNLGPDEEAALRQAFAGSDEGVPAVSTS